MRCLIRHITRRRKGGVTHDDKTFEGEHLTIGRATDQAIFVPDLRASLRHARISATPDGGFIVQAESLSGVRLNDTPVESGRIVRGDTIGIANCRVQVTEPPKGYDLALEVETLRAGKEAENVLGAQSRMNLSETALRKRPWSWALLIVVLGLFLAFPMTAALNEGIRDQILHVPAVSDAVWETGKLASVHHFIGKNCKACHEQPFIMVRDAACLECHSRTLHHVDPEFYELTRVTERRCGSCHHEHNVPSTLVRTDDALCADCHADLSEVASTTELYDASDFGRDHPEFRPTLIAHSGGTDVTTRVALDDPANLKEQSGLVFNHEVHLKEEGLKSPRGQVRLTCDDCHVPEPGGAYMRPVDMKTHCRDCHRLSFDPGATTREVPHGSVQQVMFTLEEYYGNRALRGGVEDITAPEFLRMLRRPGQKLEGEQKREALEWAEFKAREAAELLFEFRTCKTCHQITRFESDPPTWEVAPVRIADRWMPKSYFTHARHKTMQCVDCHAASESKKSEDVLLPDIASCRECHGGENARDRIASTCDDCHDFHILEGMLMAQGRTR